MAEFKRLKRNRYFRGKVLSAEDLQREQDYHLEKHRRLNRFLRGWGVVDGLRVSVEGGSTILVSPGLAIDCAGNDLVVEFEEKVPISGRARQLYVVIRYKEIPVDPTPIVANGSDEAATEFSRVLESACIEVSTTDPGTNHRGMGRGTPGCGQAHPLRLATLKRHGSRWRLDR
jgi:hypothetical protein